MDVKELRGIALFNGLSEDQLEQLVSSGEEVRFDAGDELFREAQPSADWWVLLEGTITLVRRVGHEEQEMRLMDTPGQWAGGFTAWDAHGVYLATGRGVVPGRVLRMSSERLAAQADAWFPFGVHLIKGLFGTVRSIEAVTRQREALVAIGTLAAGLAHEINNPAAAATRSVDTLRATCDALLESLRKLAEASITAEQFVALDSLRLERELDAAVADPLTLADREDELSEWLSAHRLEREWLLAPSLAAAGFDVAWCERVADTLDDDALGPGLEWIVSSLTIASLLSELKDSTGRISELIGAVKSYSQLDRASMQQMDVAEGIDSTLVMLAHKLEPGVKVVKDYNEEVPRIEAIAGELNQVWTNVIDNAVDAMSEKGTLRISTRLDRDHVIVEIRDTGPGLPEDVQARAFDPFFTTKDVGKGTGLGLDISRRIIVERHGGEISIGRDGNETVVRVSLPLAPPSNP